MHKWEGSKWFIDSINVRVLYHTSLHALDDPGGLVGCLQIGELSRRAAALEGRIGWRQHLNVHCVTSSPPEECSESFAYKDKGDRQERAEQREQAKSHSLAALN